MQIFVKCHFPSIQTISFKNNIFSDKCSEIILEQEWNKLSTIEFILNKSQESGMMSRILFSYLPKIKIQKLRFSATVSNKAKPPKILGKLFDF